jgi:hypothetical protein
MKLQVLTAASMTMATLWDIALMKAVRTPETSVNFYDTTRRSIPEGCHLQNKF